MIQVTHVICPVDFSEISQHALDHAAAIARWYDARLTVLYVCATLPTMGLPPLVLEEADALALAINMAQEADAQLTLLHIVELPPGVSEAPLMPAPDLSRVREAAAADARRRLHELIPERARPTALWTRLLSKVERIARYSGRRPLGSRICRICRI